MAVDVNKFRSAKGNFISVTWASEKKPAARFKGTKLVKRTNGVFRAGISFERLGAVQDAIRLGERGEVQPLPWGNWVEYPYFIEHKGNSYVRLYPPSKTITENGVERKVADWAAANLDVKYYVNDVETDRETFNSFLTPSEANKTDTNTDCITVKESNLIHLCESDPERRRRTA